MKILSYKYWQSGDQPWEISEIKLQNINLLVGDSGAGKTRFLNTLFNLGRFAVGNKEVGNGSWSIGFEIDNIIYNWSIESEIDDNQKYFIKKEILSKTIDGDTSFLVERNLNSFKFCGNTTPKLKRRISSISLLEEEEIIKPIHKGFGQILRRNFSTDEVDRAFSFQIVPDNLLDDKNTIEAIYHADHSTNIKLYYLSKKHPKLYDAICKFYISVFPFIMQCEVQNSKRFQSTIPSGFMPVFSIKEKNIDSWIPITEVSSGMKKVLLIIADLHIAPTGSIYLIDEYENSLGINAINFFPSFLTALEKQMQFFITSHHPYLINNIPVESWYIFHRKGHYLSIKYGDENIKRFGKSKQQRFIQLINDPFYLEGIE